MSLSSPKIKIFIQARLNSARLPAKIILPINHIPFVVLAARRASNTGLNVTVLTSEESTDDLFVDLLKRENISLFRGDLNDVLKRFTFATQDLTDNDLVIRLTGDNIFPDGDFLECLIKEFKLKNCLYMGSHSPLDHLPYGLNAEIMTIGVLREAFEMATDAFDREHVTPWIRRKYSPTLFAPLKNYPDEKFYGHLRCTMDTFTDYLHLVELFRPITDPVQVTWRELCHRLYEKHHQGKNLVPFKIRKAQVLGELILGTVQLGMPYGLANKKGQPSEKEAQEILRWALQADVKCLDTARAYGQSEKVIGHFMQQQNGANWQVITKLDPLDGLGETTDPDYILTRVKASLYESCHQLKLSTLPTLLLHNWSHYHLQNGLIWKKLIEFKEQGLIQKLGVSLNHPQELLPALKDPHIEHIQLPFNILDWRWTELGLGKDLPINSRITIHARSIFLQGLLLSPATEWPNFENIEPAEWMQILNEMVHHLHRQDIKDLCIAYVRGIPWIHGLVIGLESLEQLQENILYMQNPPLTEEEVKWLQAFLKKKRFPEKYLFPFNWPKRPSQGTSHERC